VAALWASKTATTCLVRQLNPFGWESKLVRGTAVLLTIWALTAILASIFQCALPKSWQFLENQCFDRVRVSCVDVDKSLQYS
jgi:preprotein translocase subunit SecG